MDENILATQTKLEEALNDAHRTKSLLDATIQSTASGVVVCDLETNFILINPAGRKLLGRLCELGPEEWNDSLGLFEDEDGRLLDESELPLYRACRGEFVRSMELLCRNGVADEPIWFESNAVQILDRNEKPLGAVAVFDDVTIKRKSREGLRSLQMETASKLVDTNRQLENVLNSIPEAIWRGRQTSDGFELEYLSPGIEDIAGRTPEELIRDVNFWRTHIHPEDRERIKELVEDVVSGEVDDKEVEYRLIHASGSTRWVRNRIRAKGSESGGVVQGIMTDITSERDTNLALARAERLASIGTLAAGVAHEINNPLGAMMLSAERGKMSLKRGGYEAEHFETVFEEIIQQIERCSKIVGGILKFASNPTTKRKVASLNPIAIESASFIQFKATRRKIEIEIHSGENPEPLVNVNEIEIGQVIINVLANAIDAAPDESVIEVFIRGEGDRVICSVKDNGPGMTFEARQSAFDPFYTSKQTSGGTGLGLSLSHTIIVNHGGEIWIDEPTGKQGTTVSFWLPLVEA